MKAWLKSGLIGGIVGIILLAVLWFIKVGKFTWFIVGVFLNLCLIITGLDKVEGMAGIICIFPALIGFITLFFLIGILISWIVGKMKSKKVLQQQAQITQQQNQTTQQNK